MNNQTQDEGAPQVSAPQVVNPESKAAIVSKMLKRPKGVTLAELMAATAWQAHSVRAFLSGLRKKGQVLVKEQRKSGEQTYRIAIATKDV